MSFNPLPMNQDQRNAQNLQHAYKMLNLISQRGNYNATALPKYDYTSKAQKYQKQALKSRLAAAKSYATPIPVSVSNTSSHDTGSTGIPSSGSTNDLIRNTKFGNFLRAIAAQESGGNYGAVNSSSGALGKYQIMPANVPAWSKEVLGQSVSPSYFLHHPKIQEEIARAKLRNYFKKYGATGAASAWFSGQPNLYLSSSQVNSYVKSILHRMGIE